MGHEENPVAPTLVTTGTEDADLRLDRVEQFTRSGTIPTPVQTALDGRYRPQIARGNTAVIIGDSIAAGSDNPTSYAFGAAWFDRLCSAAGQRLQFVYNAGISGNTSTQMAARFATDVVARAPRWAVIAAVSPNDVSNAIAVATRKSNITTMVDAAINAGIEPILVTSPPNDTGATRDSLLSMNAWLTGYAQANGIPLLDIFTPLVDPTDGGYDASYTGDGVHPNTAGQEAIVTALTDTIADIIRRPNSFLLSPTKSDAGNMVTNGVFEGDANADGIADSWVGVGGGLSAKQLVNMTAAEGSGNWQELTCNGSLGYVEQTISTGFSVGDLLEFSGRWENDGITGASVQLRYTGASAPAADQWALADAPTAGRVFTHRRAIPSGTTAIVVRAVINSSSGTLRVGQITLRNLTTLGVA